MASNHGGGIVGQELQSFTDFAQNFKLPDLAEDLGNIDIVLAAINEGFGVLGEQGENVSESLQFKMMWEHLEGAKQALLDIQEVNSAMQEQELYGMEPEKPGLAESGPDPENFIRVQEAAGGAKDAIAELYAQAAALASEQSATDELLGMAEAAEKAGQSVGQMPKALQEYASKSTQTLKSNQDIVKSLKDKRQKIEATRVILPLQAAA